MVVACPLLIGESKGLLVALCSRTSPRTNGLALVCTVHTSAAVQNALRAEVRDLVLSTVPPGSPIPPLYRLGPGPGASPRPRTRRARRRSGFSSTCLGPVPGPQPSPYL